MLVHLSLVFCIAVIFATTIITAEKLSFIRNIESFQQYYQPLNHENIQQLLKSRRIFLWVVTALIAFCMFIVLFYLFILPAESEPIIISGIFFAVSIVFMFTIKKEKFRKARDYIKSSKEVATYKSMLQFRCLWKGVSDLPALELEEVFRKSYDLLEDTKRENPNKVRNVHVEYLRSVMDTALSELRRIKNTEVAEVTKSSLARLVLARIPVIQEDQILEKAEIIVSIMKYGTRAEKDALRIDNGTCTQMAVQIALNVLQVFQQQLLEFLDKRALSD